METATRVKEFPEFRGQASLYHLSSPLDGADSVIVSRVDSAGGVGPPETMIFKADESGVLDWTDLWAQRGIVSHSEALLSAGYEVVES